MGYRIVDTAYWNGYPPGQIEIGIYSKDYSTLAGWATRHSGPSTSSSNSRYWNAVTNEATASAGGHDALEFDWVPDSGSSTIHDTAFFLGTAYVMTVSWWSNDPTYAPALEGYHRRMLTDLKA
ncbi:MAG: hypothetical protein ACREP9_02055 [Candidatus Dormibacteraceae bacterium]